MRGVGRIVGRMLGRRERRQEVGAERAEAVTAGVFELLYGIVGMGGLLGGTGVWLHGIRW